MELISEKKYLTCHNQMPLSMLGIGKSKASSYLKMFKNNNLVYSYKL